MNTHPRIPLGSTLAVLVGFPVVSTLLSLALLHRNALPSGVDFMAVLWSAITLWYVAQIAILGRVLRRAGYGWSDICYRLDRRRTLFFVGGYLAIAFALVALVEAALRSATLDAAQLAALSDLSNLTPKTTLQRVVFVLMGLAAGLAEELVYRGFAISALRGRGLAAWLAIPLAALPFVFQHGLKSIDQFEWFFAWGLVLGALFVLTRRLWINIAIHWLVILAALPAVLQALR